MERGNESVDGVRYSEVWVSAVSGPIFRATGCGVAELSRATFEVLDALVPLVRLETARETKDDERRYAAQRELADVEIKLAKLKEEFISLMPYHYQLLADMSFVSNKAGERCTEKLHSLQNLLIECLIALDTLPIYRTFKELKKRIEEELDAKC